MSHPNPKDVTPPIEFKANYRHAYENVRKQKKIRCCVMNKSEQAIGETPTLVAKPQTKKYGTKFFVVNNKQYWIIYEYLKDMGKYYLYLTTEDNAVGGILFNSHKEYAEPEQVNRMLDYQTVNLFKQNNGKKLMRILLFVGIGLAICAIALTLLINVTLGLNTQVGQKNTQIERLNGDKALLEQKNLELQNKISELEIPTPIGGLP